MYIYNKNCEVSACMNSTIGHEGIFSTLQFATIAKCRRALVYVQ